MKRAVGRGRKSAAWRREVNRLLPACQQAVPVWIMMIQDALRNCSTASKFDVIVVDEASQADMTALPLLYMGKKAVSYTHLKSALVDERPGGIHASRVVPSRGDDARFGAAVDFVHGDARPGVHARERLVVEHARGRQAEGDAGAFERRVEHPHEGGRRHERCV